MYKVVIPREETFKIIGIDVKRGEVMTTIGRVDPFVVFALEWHNAESLVGKTFRAIGCFHLGVFLPMNGKIVEVQANGADDKKAGE